MSRIGKQSIELPAHTAVTLSDGMLTVKGPAGELSRYFRNGIDITITDRDISLITKDSGIETRALWGTYASHIKNMVKGVNEPYVKKLEIEGVGYRYEMKGADTISLALGFSHPVIVKVPAGLKVTTEKAVMTISGIDKERVGQFAAKIRALKKPEPYKGKGIRYAGEFIRRKQGKKTA